MFKWIGGIVAVMVAVMAIMAVGCGGGDNSSATDVLEVTDGRGPGARNLSAGRGAEGGDYRCVVSWERNTYDHGEHAFNYALRVDGEETGVKPPALDGEADGEEVTWLRAVPQGNKLSIEVIDASATARWSVACERD